MIEQYSRWKSGPIVTSISAAPPRSVPVKTPVPVGVRPATLCKAKLLRYQKSTVVFAAATTVDRSRCNTGPSIFMRSYAFVALVLMIALKLAEAFCIETTPDTAASD